jgi:hypothetical protein
MYALSEDGHRLKDQDLFAEDAGHDAGARVASGELVGLVIRPLSDLNSAAHTLALPPDLTGFLPDNISWAPDEDRIAFTIGGKLAVVDVSADSLADATFVDPSDGSHWPAPPTRSRGRSASSREAIRCIPRDRAASSVWTWSRARRRRSFPRKVA